MLEYDYKKSNWLGFAMDTCQVEVAGSHMILQVYPPHRYRSSPQYLVIEAYYSACYSQWWDTCWTMSAPGVHNYYDCFDRRCGRVVLPAYGHNTGLRWLASHGYREEYL